VNPLFQVNFRVRVGGAPTLALGGASTAPMQVDLALARFDLALELHVLDDGIEAEFNYNTDLFDAATVARLATDFETLLRQGTCDPTRRLLSFALDAGASATAHPAGPAGQSGGIRRFREGAGAAPETPPE